MINAWYIIPDSFILSLDIELNSPYRNRPGDNDLISRVKSETDSGNGNYCTLLTTILEGKRAANGAVDEAKAKATAEMYVIQ